jgi:hypothetical protein
MPCHFLTPLSVVSPEMVPEAPRYISPWLHAATLNLSSNQVRTIDNIMAFKWLVEHAIAIFSPVIEPNATQSSGALSQQHLIDHTVIIIIHVSYKAGNQRRRGFHLENPCRCYYRLMEESGDLTSYQEVTQTLYAVERCLWSVFGRCNMGQVLHVQESNVLKLSNAI